MTTTRIACAELEALLRAIFLRHGCSEVVAAALAENMAGAERDGALSHGIFRVAGNLARSTAAGWMARPCLSSRMSRPACFAATAVNRRAILALTQI